MIEEVHFKNFKCLSDVRCSLAQWTVFVGPNASGKTSVLEGIYHLSKVARLEKGGDIRKVFRGHKTLENLLGSNGDGHDRLVLECESGGDRVSFTASPNAVSRVQLDQTTNGWYFDLSTWDDADVQRDKPTGVNMAQEAIETVAFLDLRASELAKPSYAIVVDPSMASSGEGLASVIASMILTRPDAFIDLLTMLKRIIPQIKNFRVAKKKLTRMERETLSFRGKSIETSIPRSVIGDCLVFHF